MNIFHKDNLVFYGSVYSNIIPPNGGAIKGIEKNRIFKG